MELKFENQYPIAYDDKRKMIHITQVTTENRLKYYYCIACGEILVACAIGEGKKVVPYFRHLNKDNCTEDVIHVCCKNWLFVEGNKVTMIVNGIKKSFVCKYIEIEKRFETPFGEYIPDITITTETDEQVFVEINHTSKKDETYCAKWEYLKSPVIEVSTKQLFESKFWNTSLELTAIFYDGVFTEDFHEKNSRDTYYNLKRDYIKSFSNIEYDKALCQKIFWFWEDTVGYNRGEISKEDFLDVFNALEMREMAYCTAFIESRKCLDIKDELSKICTDRFKEYCENYFKYDYLYNILKITIDEKSEMRTGIVLKNNVELFKHDLSQEIFLCKCKWNSKQYFNFIMNLENGMFKQDILNFYNIAEEQVQKQKLYQNEINKLSDSLEIIEFIKKMNKKNVLGNMDFLHRHIPFISLLLLLPNKIILNDIFKYIDKAVENDDKFLKRFNDILDKKTNSKLLVQYEKRCKKKKQHLVFSEFKTFVRNNKILNLDKVENKYIFFKNITNLYKPDSLDKYIKITNYELKIYDSYLNAILMSYQDQINKTHQCIQLNLIYSRKYNYYYIEVKRKNEIIEIFNVDDIINNGNKEYSNYDRLKRFIEREIIHYLQEVIPMYMYDIILDISIEITQQYSDLKIINSTISKNILLINLIQKNTIGTLIFYLGDLQNVQYDTRYKYYNIYLPTFIPIDKYNQDKIKIGIRNYFKKCIKYNYIKENNI